jgi:hypothetical protein
LTVHPELVEGFQEFRRASSVTLYQPLILHGAINIGHALDQRRYGPALSAIRGTKSCNIFTGAALISGVLISRTFHKLKFAVSR